MAKREFIGMTEAARRLGVTRAWVYQLLRSGDLTYTQIAGRYLVRPEDVDRLRDERAAKASPGD